MDFSLRTGESVREAIDKYSDMLVRISFSYMKNVSDAEDLAHDAFLKLMEKRPAFESEEHMKAWLIRVTSNLCKNRLKTSWFKKRAPLDEFTYNFTPPENRVITSVFELPSKYRGMIFLYYYEGYTIAEIAGITGMKEATVGSQLHRARNLLKSKLKEDFADE